MRATDALGDLQDGRKLPPAVHRRVQVCVNRFGYDLVVYRVRSRVNSRPQGYKAAIFHRYVQLLLFGCMVISADICVTECKSLARFET